MSVLITIKFQKTDPMNLMKKTLLLAAVLLLLPAKNVLSQESQDKPFEGKGTIENQFSYVYDKSYTFEIYKSIRIAWFQTLRSHVLDSLKNIKKELNANRKIIQAKDIQLDSIRSELTNTKQELGTVTNEKNSFRILGFLMGKQAYNSLVWFIILGLAVLLGVSIILFKRSNFVTSQTKKDLAELKDEFENFRKKSLEREEKMARKHLDELNKYKK